ncbi:MAG: DUF4962 domain-containing protein [Limnochordia bacterium]
MKTLQLHNAKIVRVLSFLSLITIIAPAFGLFTCVEAATALFTESFEEVDQNGLPPGWTVFAQGPMGRSDDYAHSGKYSYYLDDRSNVTAVTIRSPHIPIEAGEEYMASVWALIQEGNAFLYLEFWNSPDRPRISFVTDRRFAGSQWQQISATAVAPINAKSMTVILSLISNNVGKTYFDDVEVARTREHSLNARELELLQPRLDYLAAKVPAQHPRVMLHPDEVGELRAYIDDPVNRLWKNVLQMNALLRSPVILPQPLTAPKHSNDAAATAAWLANFREAANIGNTALRYAFAYLLTGDEWYAKEAETLMTYISGWKMEDTISLAGDDEAFTQMLHPWLVAYDWVAPALSPESRQIIQEALAVRLNALYKWVRMYISIEHEPTFTTGISHPVRFVSTLALGGLALYGEVEKADEILAWALTYYADHFPPWGGADGGWSEGPAYWNTAMTHHIEVADAFAALGMNDLYDLAFYENTGYYGLYVSPPFTHAALGDTANFITPGPSQFMHLQRLSQVYRNPYFARYAQLTNEVGPIGFAYYTPSLWHLILSKYREQTQPVPEPRSLAELPQARWFRDIDWVAIHSNLDTPKKDVYFLLKSSPYGGFSHSHSDQNAFVLSAYGRPLAISAGYREWYGSNHHVNYNRVTKSKNTILVNGNGQRPLVTAPGATISEFFTGAYFTMATGDAAAAYLPQELNQFDRRVLSLGGTRYLILDELAAPRASRFDWLLHASNEMIIDRQRDRVQITDGKVHLTVDFLYPQQEALAYHQTDLFDPPVDPAYNLANQWHLTVSNTVPAQEQRFLTYLMPYKQGEAEPARPQLVKGQGVIGAIGPDFQAFYAAAPTAGLLTAGGLDFQGRLAAFVQDEQRTCWLLAEGSMLQKDGRDLVKTTAPITVEVTYVIGEPVSLHIQAEQDATVTLYLAALQANQTERQLHVRSGGADIPEWTYHADAQQLTITVPQGRWTLSF